MRIACGHCTKLFECLTARITVSRWPLNPLYCGRACAGLARRREPKSDAQKKADKSEYDRQRRKNDGERFRAERRADYYAKHDKYKSQHAEYRSKNMGRHVEYCRRPEYKIKKQKYDHEVRAAEHGDFAETWKLLLDLEKEIRSQASAYDIRVANGYYTRSAQKRRRELWQLKQKS